MVCRGSSPLPACGEQSGSDLEREPPLSDAYLGGDSDHRDEHSPLDNLLR
jgi:hypothetical protein